MFWRVLQCAQSKKKKKEKKDWKLLSFISVVDRPASRAAAESSKVEADEKVTPPPDCCECFPSPGKKKWTDKTSAEMSDVYSLEEKADFSSPACLATMSKGNDFKHRHLLGIESEIEFKGKRQNVKKVPAPSPKKKSVNGNTEKYDEVADDAMIDEGDAKPRIDPKAMIRVNGKEEFPEEIKRQSLSSKAQVNSRSSEAIRSIVPKTGRPKSNSIADVHQTIKVSSSPRRGLQRFFSYNKRPPPAKSSTPTPANEETSFIQETTTTTNQSQSAPSCQFKSALDTLGASDISPDVNGNRKLLLNPRNYSTLPKMRKSHFHPSILYSRETTRTPFKVPKRTTVDGTNIYYWCDVPKSKIKGPNSS